MIDMSSAMATLLATDLLHAIKLIGQSKQKLHWSALIFFHDKLIFCAAGKKKNTTFVV